MAGPAELRKQEIVAALAAARARISATGEALHHSFDVPARATESFQHHRPAWLSGAAIVGFVLSKLPSRKKTVFIERATGKALGAAGKIGAFGKIGALYSAAREIWFRMYRLLIILERGWDKMTPAGADTVLHGNLDSVFYGAIAVLPIMRKQQDGQIIITASMAGRWIGLLSGPAYVAAKHGVVAMSHTINMEECIHGIRCTAVLPGEVATPILDKRPNPVSAEDRAKMAQKEDVGDLIRYIACLPRHVVINEVMICPTWNRGYVAALRNAAA